MKYVVILVALIILYTAFSYAKIVYYMHYSGNPEIHQKDFTLAHAGSLGSSQPLRYIAGGDSTAVGEGASTVEQTYPVKIAEALSKQNAITYHNVAVSGAKTQDVISTQLPQIIDFKPDIVTISIGANDTTHLISSQRIYENYQKIIQELTNKTGAKIYITDVPNFTGASLLPNLTIAVFEKKSASLNPKLLALETDRVKIVNIHDFGWDKFPDRRVTYSLDHFHPSDIGYQNWADAFLSKIR